MNQIAASEAKASLTAEELEFMYRVMTTSKVTDDRARAEARAGKLDAAFYPVRGLEGVCGALSVAMDRDDRLVSSYRNLGDVLAKGVSLRSVIAELYGRSDGIARGKGGPMHIKDPAVGMMATTGIVGSGLPIAVGLGLAAQLDGDGRAVVVTFGDGATAIGSFHEAISLASLWKLPVVFVCQNNGWAEHTPIEEYAPSPDLAIRAASYALPSVRVDGFDPIATYRALRTAVLRAQDGKGPTFVECVTYRLGGHSGTSDYSYMPKDLIAVAEQRDPAPAFRRWLIAEGVFDESHMDAVDSDIEAQVSDAFAFAEQSGEPGAEELYRDVFDSEEWVVGR